MPKADPSREASRDDNPGIPRGNVQSTGPAHHHFSFPNIFTAFAFFGFKRSDFW